MVLKTGEPFRHYRIVQKVGEGGMAIVYRADGAVLGRDLALKLILHAPFVASELRHRLPREARALAALNHPNIVTIVEITRRAHDVIQETYPPFRGTSRPERRCGSRHILRAPADLPA